MKRLCLFALMLLGVNCSTSSNQSMPAQNDIHIREEPLGSELFDAGVRQFNGNNMEQGLTNLRLCASLEHGGCLYFLGSEYYRGEKVERDLQKAIDFSSRAFATGLNFGVYGIQSGGVLAYTYAMIGDLDASGEWINKTIELANNYHRAAVELNQEDSDNIARLVQLLRELSEAIASYSNTPQ